MPTVTHAVDRPLVRWTAAAVALFLCGVGLLAASARIVRNYDTPGGPFVPEQKGLFDFHNGTYFPSAAYAKGVNPYGLEILEAGYPVTRPAPLFGPSHFLLHLPLVTMPLRVAEVVYCGINVLLLAATVLIPIAELRASGGPQGIRPRLTAGIGVAVAWFAFVLFSRPGHVTLVSGYFTAELAAGTIAALAWATRWPMAAALAFLLVCGKPTYAIPVWLIFLLNRNWRTAAYSAAVGGAVTAVALMWLLRSQSPAQLLQAMREGQAAHMADPYELPVNTWLRMDWVAIAAKWTGTNPSEAVQLAVMLLCYAVVAAFMWHGVGLQRREGEMLARQAAYGVDAGLSPLLTRAASLQLISIILFIYHHVYDALVLVPALIVLAANPVDWTQQMGRAARAAALVFLSMPFWNYLASESILERLSLGPTGHSVVTSANTVAVTIAAAIVLFYGAPTRSSPHNHVAATLSNP